MRYMKINKAFTLIEMLIVTVTLSIISLAIYATFNNGIKIWQKINQEIPSEDIDVFFEKITYDLRNGLKVSNITFSGEEDEFELPTLVNSRRLGMTVGKVRYGFDYTKGAVTRQRMDYSDIYNDESGIKEILLRNVKSLKFKYYIYDSEKQKYLWQDEWTKQGLPLALRIELELKNNDQANKFTKTVSIPVS